jgi:hypothetical protein
MPTLCDTLATHARVDVIIKRLADIKRTESTLATERMSLLAELSSLRPADPEITPCATASCLNAKPATK